MQAKVIGLHHPGVPRARELVGSVEDADNLRPIFGATCRAPSRGLRLFV